MHDEIGVNAVLDRHWSAWFDGLDVSSDEHDQTKTTRRRPGRRPGSLHGLLARFAT
jgi:hypothetical protein